MESYFSLPPLTEHVWALKCLRRSSCPNQRCADGPGSCSNPGADRVVVETQRLGSDCAAHAVKTRQMFKSWPVTLSWRVLMIWALPPGLGTVQLQPLHLPVIYSTWDTPRYVFTRVSPGDTVRGDEDSFSHDLAIRISTLRGGVQLRRHDNPVLVHRWGVGSTALECNFPEDRDVIWLTAVHLAV